MVRSPRSGRLEPRGHVASSFETPRMCAAPLDEVYPPHGEEPAQRASRTTRPAGYPHSQLLRNAEKESAARSVLRREYADAGAIPDLVDGVEQVDDVEAQRGRFGGRDDIEVVRHAEVNMGVGGHGADIG